MSKSEFFHLELGKYEAMMVLSALNTKFVNHKSGSFPALPEVNKRLANTYYSIIMNIEAQMNEQKSVWLKPDTKPSAGQLLMVKTKNGRMFVGQYIENGNMYHLYDINKTVTASGVAYWLDLRVPEPPID